MQLKRNIKRFGTLVVFNLVILLNSTLVHSGNVSYEKWAKHNPDEVTSINHSPMSGILKFITVENGKKSAIDYSRLNGEALNYVNQYKTYLEGIPVTLLNKDEQLAYWLNLYNTVVIEKLASNVKQLKKIRKKRGIPGDAGEWWSEKVVTIENVELSLEDIEQNILIRHWQDPLVLYGLFYGVKGAAFKGIDGFQGATVRTQLAKLAEDFIGNSKNVKVSKNKVQVSSLYAWNKSALFANDDNQLINHLQMYATGDVAAKLQKVNLVRDSHKFSWSSNAYKQPRQGGFAGGQAERGYGGGS